jgi:hypothetical protein
MLEETVPIGIFYFIGAVVALTIVAGFFGVGQWP